MQDLIDKYVKSDKKGKDLHKRAKTNIFKKIIYTPVLFVMAMLWARNMRKK